MIGELLGGQSALVIAFGLAVVMNFGSYWFSDKIILRMYKAGEVGAEHPLHQITARLAQRVQRLLGTT
jgi:heat shock protein HtpX